jgi:hypothetical protein
MTIGDAIVSATRAMITFSRWWELGRPAFDGKKSLAVPSPSKLIAHNSAAETVSEPQARCYAAHLFGASFPSPE